MRIIYVIFSILLITSTNHYFQTAKANYDFSGMKYFWNIVKILESNREPSNAEWNKLFSSPGYKVLTENEFSKDFFKDNFRLVFKPTNKNKLQSVLESGRVSKHIQHYLKVRENKKIVKEQEKKVKRAREHKAALRRTLEYLPQRRVSKSPPVSFVIFESNGRGSDPIVVDLAASIEWDYESFLAHEYHHWFRNKQLQFRFNKVDNKEANLITALSLIEAEGIADMIDKKDWYTKPSSAISNYARAYLTDVQRTPSIINYMDQALIRLSNYPNEISKIGRDIYNVLPQQGHTTGYYMARVILEKFSKRVLVKTVGNPFKFILLYNDAAKLSGGKYPVFSELSIKFIENLDQKYSF